MFKSSPPSIERNDYLIEPGMPAGLVVEKSSVLAKYLFAIIAILQVLDWHSTFRALGQGREELNPAILWLAVHLGMAGAVTVVKLIALAITAGYFRLSTPYHARNRLLVPLTLVALAYLVVVLNNYSN